MLMRALNALDRIKREHGMGLAVLACALLFGLAYHKAIRAEALLEEARAELRLCEARR